MRTNRLCINVFMVSFCCLIIIMSVMFTGCSNEEPEGMPVEISYISKNETRLETEIHYINGKSTKEQIVEILRLLCSVPDNKELRATLISGTNVINYSYEGEQVTVSLGDKYLSLPKTTEILTRAAIVRSLTAIPEVKYVMITVNGKPIVDSNGTELGSMTADMFVDDTVTNPETGVSNRVKLKLYFANETGDGLIAINREFTHNVDMSNVPMEKIVLEQLIAGPVNSLSYPSINPDTKIQSVTIQDGVCYISFDNSFLTPVNNVNTDVTIYSIVNSLAELSNINKVQISIDGKMDVKFRDKYELTTIFERDLSIVN
ncbi:MAG: GerMN domain-containing protein [Lachnospiraceae bacterium]|nr:GerMN domain-containing protein [Lachnospiraceae bacterium]MBQ2405282.1 GerMN domain-containing protein [Lachnospiraceae bacterium]MEE0920625.1 GerMN domain-containing protein [Lachnospiraceae bacterium]